MTSEWLPITSDLDEGGTVEFDVPWTEQDDDDDTYLLFELFQRTVGA